MANEQPGAHSRLYDLACAAPLILVYGFVCAGNAILIGRQWPGTEGWRDWLTIANEALTLVYFGLQIALFLVRRLPVAKSEGIAPRLAALLGANANLLLLLLPRVALGGAWLAISAALTLAGTLAAVGVLAALGRAFSIFPEARGFVAKGPYRFVRHPLYLAEIVATFGIMLQFRQPWATLIALVAIALQFVRMGHEEVVLARTFPDYAGYARRTRRLIPGFY